MPYNKRKFWNESTGKRVMAMWSPPKLSKINLIQEIAFTKIAGTVRTVQKPVHNIAHTKSYLEEQLVSTFPVTFWYNQPKPYWNHNFISCFNPGAEQAELAIEQFLNWNIGWPNLGLHNGKIFLAGHLPGSPWLEASKRWTNIFLFIMPDLSTDFNTRSSPIEAKLNHRCIELGYNLRTLQSTT